MDDTYPPTKAQIEEAAAAWCGAKSRETFSEDMEYFRHQWQWLPGLKTYVEAVMIAAREQE